MADLTPGQKAVGKKFNPSGDTVVDELKELFAKAFDIVEQNVPSAVADNTQHNYRKRKMRDFALGQILTAQMWAVKVVTLPAEALQPKADDTETDGGVTAPTSPTEPTDPNGLSAASTDTSTDDTTKTDTQSTASSDTTATPKVAPNDPTAAPAAAGSAAGVANPNAVPQTDAASQAQVSPTPATANNVA